MDAFYIILTSALFSVACGLLGCFLILRKMAMIGDAISHAVLPGIVIAFLISGSRNSMEMIAGAAILGLLTSFMIEFFHKKAKLQTDAAIGVSFTSLFALGIILISLFAGQVDLDQECVLYGEIAYVPLDLWITSKGMIMGPAPIYIAGFVLVLVLLFLMLFYPQLKLTTFDAAFAKTLGISAALWHYSLMGMVSITTVAAFDSVGAILVVALFVVAPATAYMLTREMKTMLLLTVLLSVINSILGYYLAVLINGSIAGAIVCISGLNFILSFLFSPTEGLIVKRRKNRLKSLQAGFRT
jgi:manganese/zinc/iron transport system permease protein